VKLREHAPKRSQETCRVMRDAAFEDRGRLAVSVPPWREDSPNRSAAHSEARSSDIPDGGLSHVRDASYPPR